MTSRASPAERTVFTFFLVPGFTLLGLSCAIDALRAANVELGEERFKWQLTGIDPVAPASTRIASSSGLPLEIVTPDHLEESEIIAVCGGERSHLYSCPEAERWLRHQALKGKMIGSISDGAYVPASAGLFENCRSTIHWKCQLAYRERYPKLDVRPSILEIDGKRFSCAGGTSTNSRAISASRYTPGTGLTVMRSPRPACSFACWTRPVGAVSRIWRPCSGT